MASDARWRLPPPPFHVAPGALGVAVERAAGVTEFLDLLGEPKFWGLRVLDVKRIYEAVAGDLAAYCAAHDVDGRFRHVCRQSPCPCGDHEGVPHVSGSCLDASELRPLRPNMHLLVHRYVKPWTRAVSPRFSMSTAMNASFLTKYHCDPRSLCETRIFISHCWNEPFEAFQRTLSNTLALSDVVWICAFAIPQNVDIQGALGESVASSPFAKALQQASQILVVLDRDVEPPRRVWCVYEADLALRLGLAYNMALPDDTDLEAWGTVKEVLDGLSVENCGASNEEDRRKILEAIDAERVNCEVRLASVRAAEAAEIMSAAACGHLDRLEALRTGGRDLAVARDARQRTPLHLAAERGQAKALEFLVAGGLDIEAGTYDQQTPLHLAAGAEQAEAAVASLLRLRADLEASNQEGEAPLHVAAKMGRAGAAAALLERRADLEAMDRDGLTPLHQASRRGQAALIPLLLAARADLEAATANQTGVQAIHLAAQAGRPEAVRSLLEARASPGCLSKERSEPLHLAAVGGSVATAALLLAARADVGACEVDAWTPLHRAAFIGSAEVARVLLDAGAEVDARTHGRWSESLQPAELPSRPGVSMVRMASEDSIVSEESSSDGSSSDRPSRLRPRAAAGAVRSTRHRAASFRPVGLVARPDAGAKVPSEGSSSDGSSSDRPPRLRPRAAASAVSVPPKCGRRGAGARASIALSAASLDTAPAQGRGLTPLQLAAGNGHEEVARLLVERGSQDGREALALALDRGHDEATWRAILPSGQPVGRSRPGPSRCCALQ